MKSKWSLVSSIIQMVIGILAIIAFFILAVNGENMTRWIVTLILSVVFVCLGIKGFIDNKSQK